MRAYVATTGLAFLTVTVLHVVRAFAERNLVRDPWYILITVITLALAVWAAQLFRKTTAPPTA